MCMGMIEQGQIQKLNKRLKGYHKHFKGRFMLLKSLSSEEFVLWDLSATILVDWDKNHKDTYGTFDYTKAEIGHFLNCDASSISRRSKKLFDLGLWKKLNDKRIEICGYSIFENLAVLSKEQGMLNLQSYIAYQQTSDANMQNHNVNQHGISSKEITLPSSQIDANMHEAASKQSLVSYKDNSNVISIKKVIIKGNIKTDEEYQRIYKEGDFQQLPPEDMRWIDENVSETLEVTEANEKELVDIYFDGNWEEYRRNTFISTTQAKTIEQTGSKEHN